ncbi:PREDICTED: interleukin-8-like isoform X2 [Cyprinodon variegatus]|uniref:interleukin-8-like isoform X2 n=1 Tax=Cyprinodon variegatus TaxID=28743 RepID=UPI0007426D79|nr:PREDICTED: interleukin-8-like isoform X2 [Cyprinodon variegatus]
MHRSSDLHHHLQLSILKRIRPSLIMDVIDYKPHEYCSNHEVIVILKDGDKLCLDPNSKFTKALLQAKKRLVKSSTTQSPQSLPEKSEPQAWLTSDPTAN